MGEVVELVLCEEGLHLWQLLGRDVREDEVLVGRQPEEAGVHLCDLAETGLELELGLVLDATVLDEHGEVVVAVLAGSPPKLVDRVGELVRSLGLERLSKPALDVGLEPGETHSVDGVFQTLRERRRE